jgi:chromosome segregation ATPase
MLEVIRKIAGGSRPVTAAKYREALAAIDEAVPAARVAAAEKEYKEALIAADREQIEKAETALASARRELDRCRAAIEALTSKADEAEAAEAAAALAAKRAEMEREADAVAAELRKTYPAAAKQIIRVLEKLAAAEKRVSAFNAREIAAGRAAIVSVEERAFSYPFHVYAPAFTVLRTSLQPCGGQEGWGNARLESEFHGVQPR